MSARLKVALVMLLVAVPAFLVAPALFPPPTGPGPSAGQLPFFMLLRAFDALLLGAGVAFVLFGWPMVRRVSPDSRVRAVALFAAVAWVTISWYPHIGLHGSVVGSTFGGLLAIDYLFHVPLYIVSVTLIWALIGYLKAQSDRAAPQLTASPSAAAPPAPATGV
jgi:hypothetical protein